ncbi:MAG: hypothetical protein JO028_21190, partial [Acidobacteriaceae bacterium]|nr:hypothetical protein [Acidobacteriaceae bacterium]
MLYPFRALHLLAGVSVLATAPLARADLITNGSFETPVVSSGSFLDITTGMQP